MVIRLKREKPKNRKEFCIVIKINGSIDRWLKFTNNMV